MIGAASKDKTFITSWMSFGGNGVANLPHATENKLFKVKRVSPGRRNVANSTAGNNYIEDTSAGFFPGCWNKISMTRKTSTFFGPTKSLQDNSCTAQCDQDPINQWYFMCMLASADQASKIIGLLGFKIKYWAIYYDPKAVKPTRELSEDEMTVKPGIEPGIDFTTQGRVDWPDTNDRGSGEAGGPPPGVTWPNTE